MVINGAGHIYRAIAERIRQHIQTRFYTERIPSERELAEEYGVNYKTAKKAVSCLVEEGLLVRVRGKGTYITTRTASNGIKSRLVAFFVPNLVNPYFAMLTDVFQERARRNNISVIVVTVPNSNVDIPQIIANLLAKGTEAIFAFGEVFLVGNVRKTLLQSGIPVIGFQTSECEIPRVWARFREGAVLAVSHLLETFGPPVAYISGAPVPLERDDRYHGYRDALKAQSLPFDRRLVVKSRNSIRGGYDAVMRLLDKEIRPRSLFLFNDFMAVGAERALSEAGIAIPDVMGIVGFDNCIDDSDMVVPTSTVYFPFSDIADRLLELMDRQQKHTTPLRETIEIDPQIIIRESSKAVCLV